MSSVLPFVRFLRKRRIPKLPAVIIAFLGVVSAILLLILPLIPFVITQIQTLISGFPVYLKEATQTLGFPVDHNQIQEYLTNEAKNFGRNAFSFTTQVFGGIFSFLMMFIISFYLLLYYDEMKKLFASAFKPEHRPFILATIDKTNEKLGSWLRGQVILCFFIGLISWISLILLGIPNALPLALLSGLLEIVPTLGPILSAVPAVIVALTISPTMALSVIIVYILIQLIENNLLVPKVMEKAVGLNPVIVILGVLIGANLIGFAGGLLAIPLITFIIVIIRSFDHKST